MGFKSRLSLDWFKATLFANIVEKSLEFGAIHFDIRIESNTSFRNFVFVERQLKKPFVSKQDFT